MWFLITNATHDLKKEKKKGQILTNISSIQEICHTKGNYRIYFTRQCLCVTCKI
uniref:Uncharacterized protein n=1 Tax=Rhizophora mucronata TaxID=61149 RepID=A0A2P2P0N5_RHIMU